MGAQGATNVLYRKDISAADDPQATRERLQEEYRERFASPYMAARYGMVSDVIEPSETRRAVSIALRSCRLCVARGDTQKMNTQIVNL